MIELPFPPAILSGHANGNDKWRAIEATKKHREWARTATLEAKVGPIAAFGDIRVSMTFYPPNRRGDRVNYPNRVKPYFDGIADALKVNYRRFVPAYHFAEPVENPRVVIVLEGVE